MRLFSSFFCSLKNLFLTDICGNIKSINYKLVCIIIVRLYERMYFMSQVIALNTETPAGSALLHLTEHKFNSGATKETDDGLKKLKSTSIVTSRINSGRMLLSDSYVGKISRPRIKVNASIIQMTGNIADNIDTVRFMTGDEPTFDYIYEMNDTEIKQFIDAGLYSNPRFDNILSKFLQDEQFEMETETALQHVGLAKDDGRIVPLVFVGAIQSKTHRVPVTETEIENSPYTSFSKIITTVAAIADEYARQGLSTSSIVSDLESQDEVIDLTSDLDNETIFKAPTDDVESNLGLDINDEDAIVDVNLESDDVNSRMFGESSEDTAIRELKEQKLRDWASTPVESNPEPKLKPTSRKKAKDDGLEF